MSVTIAITGASGAEYAYRLIEQILLLTHKTIYLMISKPGLIVFNAETSLKLPQRAIDIQKTLIAHFECPSQQLDVFSEQQWSAPVASGASCSEVMIVCPCSMGTLSAIAHGTAKSLIERSADVIIKEQKKLILLPRETPLSSIHLQNCLSLSQQGVLIMPPNPGFYFQPNSVSDIIDFMVAKLLDQLNIPHTLSKKWGLK